MKLKTLLVLGASMFAATASAAWTKPVLQTTDIVTDGTTEQYLLNVETGRFAIAGNDWQTRASAEATGATWKVAVEDADNSTYSLTDYVAKFKEYRKTFVDSATGIWCDNNNGANCNTWTLTPVAEGQYKIGNTAFADQYLGVQLDGKDTRLYLTSYFEENDIQAGYTWTAVTKEAYDNFAPAMKRYETAVALGEAIEDINATYPSVDVSSEKAVYDNEESTQEQLDAAVAAVKEKKATAIAQEAMDNASMANPINMTGSLVNPSFEEGNANGWTTSKGGAHGDAADLGVYPNTNGTYTCANADGEYLFNIWAWGYPITQKVNNLPNGVYRLQGMLSSSDDCTNVFLTAASGDAKYHAAVTLETNPDDSRKQTWFTEGQLWFPVTNGEVTVGAVGADADGKSFLEGGRWWYKADNFTLTYYGCKADAWQYAWNMYKDNIVEPSEEITISNDVYDVFDNARSVETVETQEAYLAAVKAVDDANALMDENIAAWKALAEEVAGAKTIVSGDGVNKQDASVVELTNYVNNIYPDQVSEMELTTAEVKDKIQYIKDLEEAVKNALQSGADVTSYLVNPDFSKGATGWNGDPAINASCGEKYNAGVFDVYQEIKDAPLGLYEISVQGFYRQYRDDGAGNDQFKAWNNIFEDTEDAQTRKSPAPAPMAFVYMNDMKTALNTVYDFPQAIDGADGEGNPTCSFYGTTGGWGADAKGKYAYPNNMASAAAAFASGAYTVKAYGLVAKAGDVLRVGVKGDLETLGGASASWAIFDNFHLTYRAQDPAIVDELLPTVKAGVNLNQLMGADVKAAAEKAMQTAETATDADAKYNALCEVASASAKIDASVAIFKQLTAKYGELNAANNAATDAMDDALAEADDLLSEIEPNLVVATVAMTDEQALAAIDAATAAIAKLAIPKSITEATTDAPVDMTKIIVNPSFEDGHTTGWTHLKGDGTVQLGPQNNSSFGKTGTYYAEKWHANGNYQMSQDIKFLPAGTYVLAVDGHASNGAKLYANTEETDFTNQVDAMNPANDKVVFYLAEGEDLAIGVKGVLTDGTWICVDNFTLTCYAYNENKVDEVKELITGAEIVKAKENVNSTKVAKFFQNGKIIIVKNGKVYTVGGAQMK